MNASKPVGAIPEPNASRYPTKSRFAKTEKLPLLLGTECRRMGEKAGVLATNFTR
jgi:hypothetical protein